MDTVYIVMGTTGEYSDREEWPVCAYTNEQAAQQHVEAAEKRAKEIEVLWRGNEYRMPEGLKNEHDPDMAMEYTGTHYYIMATQLRD